MKRHLFQRSSPKEKHDDLFYFALLRILILIFVIMLIGTLILTYFFNLNAYRDNLTHQTKISEAMIADAIDDLGNETLYVSGNENIVALLKSGEDTALRESLESTASHVVERAVELMPNYVGIRVQGKNQELYLKNTNLDIIDVTDEDKVVKGIEDFDGLPYRMDFAIHNDQALAELCAPVVSENGEYLGCVSMYFDNDFITLPDSQDAWGAVLFDSASWMPVGTKEDLSLSEANEKIKSASGLMEGIIKTENTKDVFTYTNPEGQRMMGIVVKDATHPIALMTSVNKRVMCRDVLKYSAYHVILTAVLLVVFVLVLYFFYGRMKRPVRELSERCRRMLDGERDLDFGRYDDGDMNELSDTLLKYREKLETEAYCDKHLYMPNFLKGYRDICGYIQSESPITVCLLDVANFGKYNQIFSVKTGNEILARISSGLKKIYGDRIYHVYGDMFMGINPVPDCDDGIQLELQKLMDSEIDVGAACFQLNYKGAVCRYPEDARSAEELVEKLWQTLNFAKSHSEEPILVYSPAVLNHAEREKKILELLKKQIALQDFDVWYQPVYNYKEKCYTTAEALMRLKDESGQYVAPHEAIRVAEKYNLVTEIGELILTKACKTMKFLSDQGSSIENITVNLSVQQLVDQDYGKKTLKIIRDCGITPDQICVEVTAALLLQSFPVAIDVLNQMRAAGIRLILDNFGLSGGSLAYFSRISFAFVKLDYRLLQLVRQDQEQFGFIKKMVEMIKVKGVKVVAERVETEEDLDWMVRCGADYIQGYYYSRPLEENAFCKLVKSKN